MMQFLLLREREYEKQHTQKSLGCVRSYCYVESVNKESKLNVFIHLMSIELHLPFSPYKNHIILCICICVCMLQVQ